MSRTLSCVGARFPEADFAFLMRGKVVSSLRINQLADPSLQHLYVFKLLGQNGEDVTVNNDEIGQFTNLQWSRQIQKIGQDRGIDEDYFGGASPIFMRSLFSWSALQYLQSRRMNNDVYGMVVFVFSTNTWKVFAASSISEISLSCR